MELRKYFVTIALLLLIQEIESKRSKYFGGSGSRRKNVGSVRTTPKSHRQTTRKQHQYTTQSHGRQDIGFENIQHEVQAGKSGIYQPQSYYNPHISVSNGPPPHIYQPVHQSSDSSVLGHAGSFAGGYLIGRLASGGSDLGDRQYTVHHYHHNGDQVSKQVSVGEKSLVKCSGNVTQGLCVPNTFPLCLVNGTIMCVTHARYTIPCGGSSSMACVVTVLPCANRDTKCDNSTANFSNTAVYIPCISNVTLARLEATENKIFKVKYCITAIAKPKRKKKKKSKSTVVSFMNMVTQLSMLPISMTQPMSGTTNDTIYGFVMQAINGMNKPTEKTITKTTTQIPIASTSSNYYTYNGTTQVLPVLTTSAKMYAPYHAYNIQTLDTPTTSFSNNTSNGTTEGLPVLISSTETYAPSYAHSIQTVDVNKTQAA